MSFPAQRVDLGSTFGALFIGLIIGAVSVKYLFIAQAVDVEHFSVLTYPLNRLFGVGNAQVFVYFSQHGMWKEGVTTYYSLVVSPYRLAVGSILTLRQVIWLW